MWLSVLCVWMCAHCHLPACRAHKHSVVTGQTRVRCMVISNWRSSLDRSVRCCSNCRHYLLLVCWWFIRGGRDDGVGCTSSVSIVTVQHQHCLNHLASYGRYHKSYEQSRSVCVCEQCETCQTVLLSWTLLTSVFSTSQPFTANHPLWTWTRWPHCSNTPTTDTSVHCSHVTGSNSPPELLQNGTIKQNLIQFITNNVQVAQVSHCRSNQSCSTSWYLN